MRGERVIWFIVPLMIAGFAPTWEAWRWALARHVYADKDFPTPTMTPQHVEALRKLRFAWNTLIESGGPIVDPVTPYGSEDLANDLGSIIGTRDQVAIASFHREVSSVLFWALKNCELAEGKYRLAHLDNASMERRLRRELAILPPKRIEAILSDVPRLEPDGYFRFTNQHRRLLHELDLEWPDQPIMWIVAGSGYPAPAVHFKRPFGDMSAFEIDMAAILDLPYHRGDPFDPLLRRLYWDMWPALQAFVEHVALDGVPPACAGK